MKRPRSAREVVSDLIDEVALHGLGSDLDRVADRAGVGAPMSLDDEMIEPDDGGAAVLFPIREALDLADPAREQAEGDLVVELFSVRDLGQLLGDLAHTFEHLEDDVADEAFGDQCRNAIVMASPNDRGLRLLTALEAQWSHHGGTLRGKLVVEQQTDANKALGELLGS